MSAAPAFAQDSTAPESPAPVPEVEESDVAVLPEAGPHWMLSYSGFANPARLIDGDTGEIKGSLHLAPMSNIAVAPDKSRFYVAETIWSKGNRGTRQDMITVYDAKTLTIDYEIPLPGRLLVGDRVHDLDVSSDGRYAYVYDMAPASSVIAVDLQKRKVLPAVEIPGCALTLASGTDKVLSLCGDGSLAAVTLTKGKGTVEQTDPVFSADEDPVYDNSVFDTKSGKGFLLSYSGLVYEVTVGDKIDVAAPWSLQEGAHMEKATTKPLVVNWLPGGQQPIAYNATTGRLYVLMHMGEFWTYKEPGEELWEVDAQTHKVLRRAKLETPIRSVAVSQDAEPVLFLNEAQGGVEVWDVATLSQKHTLEIESPGELVGMP